MEEYEYRYTVLQYVRVLNTVYKKWELNSKEKKFITRLMKSFFILDNGNARISNSSKVTDLSKDYFGGEVVFVGVGYKCVVCENHITGSHAHMYNGFTCSDKCFMLTLPKLRT